MSAPTSRRPRKWRVPVRLLLVAVVLTLLGPVIHWITGYDTSWLTYVAMPLACVGIVWLLADREFRAQLHPSGVVIMAALALIGLGATLRPLL